jgi:hypothetical protein
MSSSIQSQGAAEVHPDVLLVERARQGDMAAFEKLVRQYDRQVFRIAQHIVQNREDAEDVVQDAFLKAYRETGPVPGELEVLYLAGAHRGERIADAAAETAHGQDGLD